MVRKRKGRKRGVQGVAWVPIRCPHCGARERSTYGTFGGVRYHLCAGCGERYKSVEEEQAAQDADTTRGA